MLLTSLFVGSVITAGAYSQAKFYTSTTGTSGTFTLKGSASLTSGSDGYLDIDMTANQTLYFYIQGDSNNNYWGCDSPIPLISEYNLVAYYNSSDAVSHKATFTSTSAGTYRFTVTGLTGSAKIRITQVSIEETTAATSASSSSSSSGESGTSISSLPTESSASGKLIFNSNSSGKAQSAWLWKGTGNGKCYALTNKGTVGTRYLSEKALSGVNHSDAGSGDPRAIPFKYAYSDGSSPTWSNRLTDENCHFGSGTTSGTITDDNWYAYISSSSSANNRKSWQNFVHVGSTFKANNSTSNSTILLGQNISLAHSSITGTLAANTTYGGSTTRHYTYAYKGPDNNYYRIGNEKRTDATVTFTPTTAGTYTFYGFISDAWDYETKLARTITVTVENSHTINFSASSGGSISPNGSQKVGVTTKTNVTATANAGYEFSNWSTSGVTMSNDAASGDGRTAKVVSTADGSVRANFVAKKTYAITTASNNKRLGTVSVSPSSAYAGQEVTITPNEDSGTFSSVKITKTSDGTDVTSSVSYNSTTKKFTMPAYAVTVTGTFTEFTGGNTRFYYNSYGDNGQPASTHYAKAMTEAKVSGETFSYYHVTGRTETDQLFTVSYDSPKYNNYDCFFEIYKDWESSGVSALFYATDGKNLGGWTNMTWVEDKTSTKKFKTAIPDGARSVRFKNNAGNDETDELFFTSGNNGWYHTGDNFKAVTGYNQSNPVSNKFYENFYGENKYTDNFSTGGFYDHGANRGEEHKYIKPKGLDESQRGDYYILVLYENKTYTINGETHKVTKNPEIIWSPTLPGAVETVTVYAKDGTVRWSGDSPTTTNGKLGDTVITNDSTTYPGVSNITSNNGTGNASDCNYQTAKVEKGMKFQVTTTVESEFRATHYVKAFMVNGKGYKFFTHSNNGVYTMEYTVPEEFDGKTIEITPVYFLKDESDTVTFKIDGFDPTIQTTGKWGTTLYAYPFYAETVAGYQSAFYGYPGQPVIEDNGKYYIQIPIHNSNPADTNSTVVRGITLSNGYLDDVHKVCESTYVTDHRQTYDYDDFYKIYNEKHPDNITFAFKYKGSDVNPSYPNNATREQKIAAERNAGNNKRASFTDSSYASKFEQLKNYHGQIVNIFGTVLDSVTDAKTLYVISDGYWYNNAGSFGTEWCVFTKSGNTYTYKGEIVPSALSFNNADSFDKAAYAQTDDTSHGKEMLSSYKAFYNTLKASYSDYQVKIIYEENIKGGNYKRINATNNQEAEGEDTAYRLDGRWTYSNDDDIINANIQIRYLDLTHSDIKDSTADTFGGAATSSAEKPVGDTTGAVAYFTNSDLNQASESYQNKMATGNVIGNKNKEFTFTTAISTPKTYNYVFQGWYLLKDGKYSPMSKASSPMNATETYVALYRQSSDSTITVSHNLMSGSGAGLTEVKLEVSGSANSSYDKVYDFSAEPITATIDTGSTVIVTLSSTSAGANTFNGWYNSDGTLLDNGGSDNGTVVKGAAKQVTLTSSDLFTGATPKIRSKEYLSDFHNVTRTFKAIFNYTNRFNESKKYTVKTVLDTYYVAANPTTSLDSKISEGVTLKQWIKDNAPKMIDLYGKTIKWTMTDTAMTSGFNASENKININSATEAKKWKVIVETHSDGDVDNNSTKNLTTVTDITDNTYVEKSAGVYFTPENNAKFSYWSVFALDIKTGEPKNDNELLRIYNYEFKAKIAGDYYIKAIYTPGTVTKASVQDAVYSREVYDIDEEGNTKKDDLYADFIYSYMSERNSIELKNNTYYISGIAAELSQGTTVPAGSNKAVDYSEYTFNSNDSTILGFVENIVTASTANGAKIGNYTYTEDGKADDKRVVYSYPIDNSKYNNFNRGDLGIRFDKDSNWNKYIMKAYYYVKNVNTGEVQISEPVYFCLHNTKVTVYATSNSIVES